MNRKTSTTPRYPPGELFALSAASLTGSALMASMAWAHMRALEAAYGVICGTGAGQLAHCPACYGAVGFLGLAAVTFALAQAARRAALPAKA
jgi:hypothetical protein